MCELIVFDFRQGKTISRQWLDQGRQPRKELNDISPELRALMAKRGRNNG